VLDKENMELEELVNLGSKMGFTGELLQEFVTEQQNRAREERVSARSHAVQTEQNKFTAQTEQARIKASVELEKYKHEADTAERIHEHELNLARINNRNNADQNSNNGIIAVEKPKLPSYDGNENLSTYLIRFERVCDLIGVDRTTYAIRLGTLLQGKAAELYSSLPPDITSDYDRLRDALLMGFGKTADTYRLDFRSARCDNETYAQFLVTLRRKLNLWLHASKVNETYEDLANLLLHDQFMTCIKPELRTFLKERGSLSLNDTVHAADCWSTAHPASDKPNPSSFTSNQSGQQNPNVHVRNRTHSNVTCHNCGVVGHIKPNCPSLFKHKTVNSVMGSVNPFYEPNVQQISHAFDSRIPDKYMSHGTVNGANVSTIVRDTGCQCIVISKDVVPDAQLKNCKTTSLSDYLGRTNLFPYLKCYLKCKFYDGWVTAVIAPLKCCSVLVGNVPGVMDPNCECQNDGYINPPAVNHVRAVTRSQNTSNVIHPLIVPDPSVVDLTPDEFKSKQLACPSLAPCWEKCRKQEESRLRDGSIFKYVNVQDFLYRKCVYSPNKLLIGRMSLVLPVECRKLVLETAHECPVAGHFSHNKTYAKIASQFFWPGASMDTRLFCQSCDICQRMSPKRVPPVQLVKMPIIDVPFSRVSMDIVGPLTPATQEGHKYILTVIDWATGFPEAVPLKHTDSVSVAEALLGIFSRVGIPREILSDQGTNFTSKLMGELHTLLGVKPLFSSIYHAQGNGRVERLHLTLKNSLRKLCADKPRQWHRYLVATLFALRELPSNRSGFSPFELLYGRQVRGPISVLKDLWTNPSVPNEQRDVYQYIIDLRNKLDECSRLAHVQSKISQNKFSTYFDLKAKSRSLKSGDEALVLLPDSSNKLLVCWKGPFKVMNKLNRVNYTLNCGGQEKVYHINLLKQYHRRTSELGVASLDETRSIGTAVPHNVFFLSHAPIIDESSLDIPKCSGGIVVPKSLYIEVAISTSKGISLPQIADSLSLEQNRDVQTITDRYKDVFSDVPGHTRTVVHKISLKTSNPVCSNMYPVPVHLKPIFNQEVDNLYELGFLEGSISEYRSPVVLVKKTDDTYRMTIDYRALNSISRTDAEPAFNMDDDIHKLVGTEYFTELDICKAYYQVELDVESRPFTAFPTHRGLMQWTRLPFGLNTACQTYARLMRRVLLGVKNTTFYFDNILIFTRTWSEHLETVNEVLDRLRQHGLTVKPSKCNIGFNSINYLGLHISKNTVLPIPDKIEAITNLKLPPPTKKGLRSFLGLLSFYRKFLCNLATMVSPLTALLKSKVSEPLEYNDEQISGFHQAKNLLISSPILNLPNLTLPFIVRSDSSGTGLGAVLLQFHDDVPMPVSYASRQLTDNERKFSTVERECLAILFAVQRFSHYLIGKKFVLEVDHRPLVYLSKMKNLNSRLARWSLCLQPFDYSVVYIPGSENVGADYFSRCE
jgi:transposase InsO family protein